MITGKARACSVFIEMQGVALWTKGKINKRFIRDTKKTVTTLLKCSDLSIETLNKCLNRLNQVYVVVVVGVEDKH